MNDEDFEYQLRQEELEAEKKKIEAPKSSETENPYVYKDPNDGTEFEWNPELKAWFPKIDDDFLANYQKNYGSYEQINDEIALDKQNSESAFPANEVLEKNEDININDEENKSRKRPAKEEPPQWFDVDDEHNTNVYVSNLPMDISEEEFVTLMKKCGFIMKDERGKLKIKLYRDELGLPKGDGRCCYIKVESVDLALKILDESEFRGKTIKVERAKFSLKGDYNPSLKPKKKKLNKKDKEKQKKKLEKLFDWRPDKAPGERAKNEKTVVIKNMFDPKNFETDPKLILEYKADLRDECEEKCGSVRKVEIFDLHPEGVATITFNEFDDADKCVELMNGRFFAGRRLDSFLWDGKTKFKIQETDEEIEKRIQKWDEFLEKSEDQQTEKSS